MENQMVKDAERDEQWKKNPFLNKRREEKRKAIENNLKSMLRMKI